MIHQRFSSPQAGEDGFAAVAFALPPEVLSFFSATVNGHELRRPTIIEDGDRNYVAGLVEEEVLNSYWGGGTSIFIAGQMRSEFGGDPIGGYATAYNPIFIDREAVDGPYREQAAAAERDAYAEAKVRVSQERAEARAARKKAFADERAAEPPVRFGFRKSELVNLFVGGGLISLVAGGLLVRGPAPKPVQIEPTGTDPTLPLVIGDENAACLVDPDPVVCALDQIAPQKTTPRVMARFSGKSVNGIATEVRIYHDGIIVAESQQVGVPRPGVHIDDVGLGGEAANLERIDDGLPGVGMWRFDPAHPPQSLDVHTFVSAPGLSGPFAEDIPSLHAEFKWEPDLSGVTVTHVNGVNSGLRVGD